MRSPLLKENKARGWQAQGGAADERFENAKSSSGNLSPLIAAAETRRGTNPCRRASGVHRGPGQLRVAGVHKDLPVQDGTMSALMKKVKRHALYEVYKK